MLACITSHHLSLNMCAPTLLQIATALSSSSELSGLITSYRQAASVAASALLIFNAAQR